MKYLISWLIYALMFFCAFIGLPSSNENLFMLSLFLLWSWALFSLFVSPFNFANDVREAISEIPTSIVWLQSICSFSVICGCAYYGDIVLASVLMASFVISLMARAAGSGEEAK